jgi:hypothetical protein
MNCPEITTGKLELQALKRRSLRALRDISADMRAMASLAAWSDIG